VSPVNRGATGRRRPGKPQFRAQARPGSFFALAHGIRGLVAGRSIACQGVKRRSNSTVKLGTAVVFSDSNSHYGQKSGETVETGFFSG